MRAIKRSSIQGTAETRKQLTTSTTAKALSGQPGAYQQWVDSRKKKPATGVDAEYDRYLKGDVYGGK